MPVLFKTPLKIWAMPRARDGAPPVRAEEGFFARAVSELSHGFDGDREIPTNVMVATAAAGVAPTTPAGELTAK